MSSQYFVLIHLCLIYHFGNGSSLHVKYKYEQNWDLCNFKQYSLFNFAGKKKPVGNDVSIHLQKIQLFELSHNRTLIVASLKLCKR